jgi:LytS/YehU family sensor histidine kinase
LQLKEQELNYLKMQIHPHFLFNTLNTIYGFALKQSKETPNIILKLSNLLDYILYQVNKPRVLLSEELQHVKEYIDLERIRFLDSLKVEYRMDEIPPDLMIAPMLIIPLVENAFKHGSLLDGFLRVRVDVEVRDRQLLFCIRNTAFTDRSKKTDGGIGLENVRKRLDLHYEGAYQLETVYEEPWFEARITVQLVNKAAHEA